MCCKFAAEELGWTESWNVMDHKGWHTLVLSNVYILLDRFSYLERHGDIQMLALLSCVFKEPFRNTIAVTGMTPVWLWNNRLLTRNLLPTTAVVFDPNFSYSLLLKATSTVSFIPRVAAQRRARLFQQSASSWQYPIPQWHAAEHYTYVDEPRCHH